MHITRSLLLLLVVGIQVVELSLQTVGERDQGSSGVAWRSEYSKLNVWYATFGSNMWKDRFFCYIQGGQVEGMTKPCTGAMDKTLPKPEDILWKTYRHRLFFGRNSSVTWGPGGTAFINPKKSKDQAYLLLYKITFEQFNDVMFQENGIDMNSSTPLFSLHDLKSVEKKKLMTLPAIEKGWYNTILYLGKKRDLPVLTMTCSLEIYNKFKSGELPMVGAAKKYAEVIIKGLVEGELLTEKEAKAYIHKAETKPL
ncbi:Histone deacetylase [Melia azedarach]|uniref:Histone deacetylase n=1 Tax=Melia azedarach TaxID=155640 RepID=A0ACC1XQJ1_MELAZ|nr:Histone deacetylase [Melia azedarach]